MLFARQKKITLPAPEAALPGRLEALVVDNQHFVLKTPLKVSDDKCERAFFGMGCFWGAEKRFWALPGVISSSVGYGGGYTPNPTYEEVCSGETGHTELVQVCFDSAKISFAQLLDVFWNEHDPTQGMRQGNDVGTQYRSAIYCTNSGQLSSAKKSRDDYQILLSKAGFGEITTEIKNVDEFYYAESYHQQYLAKHPNGYCGLKSTGVKYLA